MSCFLFIILASGDPRPTDLTVDAAVGGDQVDRRPGGGQQSLGVLRGHQVSGVVSAKLPPLQRVQDEPVVRDHPAQRVTLVVRVQRAGAPIPLPAKRGVGLVFIYCVSLWVINKKFLILPPRCQIQSQCKHIQNSMYLILSLIVEYIGMEIQIKTVLHYLTSASFQT